jgi:hypothetical protein
VIVVAVGISGCSGKSQGPLTTKADQLIFKYQRIAASGSMDQVLTILNKGPSATAPTLEFTPLDASGAPVPGIAVRTAYGSDQGRVVIPFAGEALDVLAFSGGDIARVADVRVRVRTLAAVDYPPAPKPAEPQPVTEKGDPTTEFGPFAAVAVRNPNLEEISVGVVCILWNQPPAGEPQQALAAISLGAATIPGGVSRTVPLSESAKQSTRNGCGSLKVYFTSPG